MLAKSQASDAVAAAASEKTPQVVVIKYFQPAEIFYTDRPCLSRREVSFGLKPHRCGLSS